MTREDYLNLLRAHDDPVKWEFPAGFDYVTAELRAALLKECVEQAIGLPCEIMSGAQIQDASFHAAIRLPMVDASDEYQYPLRLSNFGNFAAVYEKDLDPAHLRQVLGCLSQLGYQYIPTDVLMEKYDGTIKSLRSATWENRYFDWM